ncbi:hypothetical protein V144x_31440 [Gimesia aquarii]|uniref:Uncharacterized protein n=1 Tax=Gimesia aquarii TaxID=2527964 RepID=A0A517VXD6_9PLAN|nr:hypothetical protein V144x_31440 [Gimesia aquarii]
MEQALITSVSTWISEVFLPQAREPMQLQLQLTGQEEPVLISIAGSSFTKVTLRVSMEISQLQE